MATSMQISDLREGTPNKLLYAGADVRCVGILIANYDSPPIAPLVINPSSRATASDLPLPPPRSPSSYTPPLPSLSLLAILSDGGPL